MRHRSAAGLVVPWKYNAGEVAPMPEAVSDSESRRSKVCPTREVRSERVVRARATVHTAPALLHGHAVPLPSPKHSGDPRARAEPERVVDRVAPQIVALLLHHVAPCAPTAVGQLT